MFIARSSLALMAILLLVVTPACAKKKSSGSSGSSEKDANDGDGDDDGTESETSTKTDTDPCTASLIDEETKDPCEGEAEGLDPDSAFFEEFLTPPKMKDCTEQGLLYLRCTGECSDVQVPAKFKCDRAGIEEQYKNVQGAKEDLANYLDTKKYFIDQCGVTAASKPFVALACFTAGDGVCVDKEDLDTETAKIETHFLTTDTSLGDQCPDEGAAP